MNLTLKFVLVGLLILSFSSCKQKEISLKKSKVKQYAKFISEMKSKGFTTGNILVYENSEVVFQSSDGLRLRNSRPKRSGMLFIYDSKRDLSMWMKNTFISLDILFLDEDGTIINIAKSTEPRSLSIINSKHEAKAVLELNGGLTNELEIMVGDRIIHSSFKNFDK